MNRTSRSPSQASSGSSPSSSPSSPSLLSRLRRSPPVQTPTSTSHAAPIPVLPSSTAVPSSSSTPPASSSPPSSSPSPSFISTALIPRSVVNLAADKEVVCTDALGDALRANIKGGPVEALAQRLVIREENEDAFFEELQRSVTELTHTGLLPVVGASKDLTDDEEHCTDYLLISKKYDMTGDMLLKQQEAPTLEARIGWALSIAEGLHFLYEKIEGYFHGQVNLRHTHMNTAQREAYLACWAFRSHRVRRKDRPPTLADFHWKSPEVLVNEKRRGSMPTGGGTEGEPASDLGVIDAQAADVYSFGILLWELCCMKQAFTDYKSLGALIEGVSVRRHRPTIPEEWPESLGSLALSCWQGRPELRPRFAEVASKLRDVLLETIIEDSLAREFWSTRFADKEEVEFSVFQPSFYAFLGLPAPNKKSDVKCNCLRAIIKELHDQNKEVVTLRTFSDMTHWFGPLEKGSVVLDRINELCAKPWFFGRISGPQAEEAVCKADKGAYLFRFSASKPGSYAITVHSRRGGAKHFRVYHEPGLNYLIGKTECKSLDEIVFKFKADLNLLSACPGSPFLELFRQDNFLKARYDTWETDEDHDDEPEDDIW